MQEQDLKQKAHEDSFEAVKSVTNAFTLIQSRRLVDKPPTKDVPISLCPSMDLMWLQNALYRTVPVTGTATTHSSGFGNHTPKLAVIPQAIRVPPAWRPDGRWIAVAVSTRNDTSNVDNPNVENDINDNNPAEQNEKRIIYSIQLYSLEDLISSTTLSGKSSSNRDAAASSTNTVTLPFYCDNGNKTAPVQPPLKMLAWAHVSKGHWQWRRSNSHLQRFGEQSSSMLLPESPKLPPSEYHTIVVEVPTMETPLSVLIALFQDGTINMYLHGRYPILTKQPVVSAIDDINDNPVQICVSPDLTHYMFLTANKLTMACWPRLGLYRQHWQRLTTLYTSMQHHFQQIQQSLSTLQALYKSALLPLDRKLETLVSLLQRYQVCERLQEQPSELLRYALLQSLQGGHVPRLSNLNNALDQFFTSVAMNDQLMQRLERSLLAAVANIETSVSQQLLAPIQALSYHARTYVGLARAYPLIYGNQPTELYQMVHVLDMTAAAFHQHWVDARWRWHDLVAWLRATASVCKARGTARNSVQREQAVKKRLDAATRQRIQSYLLADTFTTKEKTGDDNHASTTNLTEQVLGLQLSEWFRTSSSEGIAVSNLDSNRSSTIRSTSFPSLPLILQKLNTTLHCLLDFPRTKTQQKYQQIELNFSDSKPLAITTRLGQGVMKDTSLYGQEAAEGFLDIDVVNDQPTWQWALVASLSTNHDNIVVIYALPLQWIEPEDYDDCDEHSEYDSDDKEDSDWFASWYGQLVLQVPAGVRILDAAFYNDDGKSSLSSDNGQEGSRQSLTLCIEYQGDVQIYQIPYNDVKDAWTRHEWMQKSAQTWSCSPILEGTPYMTVIPQTGDEETLNENCVVARVRNITTTTPCDTNDIKLIVKGSRGIGALITHRKKEALCLELYDLEEDEYDEDTEEDGEDDSSAFESMDI